MTLYWEDKVTISTKTCDQCGETKTVKSFSKRGDGYSRNCKGCSRRSSKAPPPPGYRKSPPLIWVGGKGTTWKDECRWRELERGRVTEGERKELLRLRGFTRTAYSGLRESNPPLPVSYPTAVLDGMGWDGTRREFTDPGKSSESSIFRRAYAHPDAAGARTMKNPDKRDPKYKGKEIPWTEQ